jgi:transposase
LEESVGEKRADGTTFLPGCDTPQSRPVVHEHEKRLRLRPVDRNQMILHPIDIDRLIPEDHEARAIWELVGSLDLTLYYDDIDSREGDAGAPAFDPRLLVSLWIYAYSKGVSSAREITRLSEYDPAYQWLTAMCPVNYHTLADFRSTHGESLRKLFIEVLALLTKEGLVTMERVMHDGTRIKAFAGRDTLRKEETIRTYLAAAEVQVKAMEEASKEEIAPRIRKAHERAVRERKERLVRALDELKKMTSAEPKASVTDPDSRIMGQSDGGYAPAYNVQISTDAHEKAIVAVSLSQSPADQTLLPSAIEEIKKTTGTHPAQLVVDAGFTTREAMVTAEETGIDLIGSFTDKGTAEALLRNRGIEEAFWPGRFHFDQEKNCFICPEGKALTYISKRIGKGKTELSYRGKRCKECPSKPLCCPQAPKGRVVTRIENDPRVDAFLKKMETDEAKALYRHRSEVAEFPNAWIKEKFGLRQFRLRGLVKAGIEALWACLTYNVKLWIRLCWKPRLYAEG